MRRYRLDESVNALLFVSRTEGSSAKVWYYLKNNSAWHCVFESDAFVGKNGMNKSAEGDGKTPCGDYSVTGAFGICENPGTALDYIQITQGTVACEKSSEYYNKIIDASKLCCDRDGEMMYAYSPEYNYGLTIDYNSACEYPKGSAIFIHCKGQLPFTMGCVALSEADMLAILKTASRDMHVFLDEYCE